MRTCTISILIGVIVLLVVPQPISLTPMARVQSGMVTISGSGYSVESIDSTADRIVVVHFSAESAAIEFFVIQSDYYNLAGLPDIELCQFHTVAKSGTFQFKVDSSDIWYLVFANSPQSQEVNYEWIEYTFTEWNTQLAIRWTIISAFVVAALLIIAKFARDRGLGT